jgi:hypothetical protein
MIYKFVTFAAAMALLSGCGTIVRGTTEDIAINATPSHARITTTMGQNCTGSCIVKVARSKSFTVTADAEGYETQSVAVNSTLSGGGAAGLAGNVIFGGVIGIGVDAVSGAAYDHSPNPVRIDLRPISGARSYEPPRMPRYSETPRRSQEPRYSDAPRVSAPARSSEGGYRYDDQLGLVRNHPYGDGVH